MAKLLAIIPEDGWAMVRDDGVILFVRPPFRETERVPVSEETLADAVAVHGYQSQHDAPEESWAAAIERIGDAMVAARNGKELPSNRELLSRMFALLS